MKTNTVKPLNKEAIIRAEYLSIRRDLTYPAAMALHYAKQWAEIQELECKYDITIEADQDDTRLRGNAIASGDDAEDKRVEDELIERLNRGDVWAWADVTVRVRYAGIEEEEHLGCCSYADEKDFKKGGYYYDMVTTCVDRILEQIEEDQGGEH